MSLYTLPLADLPNDGLDLDDDALLQIVQRQTVRYFWEGAHPVSGLARDRLKTTGESHERPSGCDRRFGFRQ